MTIDDITNEYVKQVFASLDDVLDYKVHEELVVDTDGNAVKLYDKQKALDSLTKLVSADD